MTMTNLMKPSGSTLLFLNRSASQGPLSAELVNRKLVEIKSVTANVV